MRLYHTTPIRNWRSIRGNGLQTRYSLGKLPAVWLHEEDRTAWAFLHCVKRHGGRVEDIITIAVDVPDELVRRSSADGLFYILKDVPAANIISVKGFAVVSVSPLEGR